MDNSKIQILSLREWTNEEGKTFKHDRLHFKKGWRAESVKDLFDNYDKYIGAVPQSERWNLYYTACRCLEEKGRKFVDQDIIPIDIDGIDRTQIKEIIDVVGQVTQLDMGKVGIIDSGNGLQFIILLKRKIENVQYFDVNRGYYKAMCGHINTKLFEEGIIGEADVSVFSGSRLLRMPMTENRKPKGNTQAVWINRNLETVEFNLAKVSGLPELLEADHISQLAYSRLPKPDTEGVVAGCGFIQNCRDNQEKISEPEWYAMISVVGRLDKGHKLVHEFSSKHTGYNPDLTDRKITQALDASGPRTCSNISTMYDGCKECPHWQRIKSPIQIKGENHISTRDTGFWNIVITKEGQVKHKDPNYDDLVRHYDSQHRHVVIAESGLVYRFNDKYWEVQEKVHIEAFAETVMNPKPNITHCNEFYSKMRRTNVKDDTWLIQEGKINLANGVLDVKANEFLPHSHKYGFTYVLPFNYTPEAKCPTWDWFIDDVTRGNKDTQSVLQEVMGMCLSFLDPKLIQKCAILIGSGANGKTVYLDVLKHLIGKKNFSTTNLKDAATNPTTRMALMDKMANITEETPSNAFMDSSFFKDIVSGGDIEARKLYHGPVQFKFMSKVVMACNNLPTFTDCSNGMKRRLILIPFNRTYSKQDQDPFLTGKLIQEAEGIFNWALEGVMRLQKNRYQFTECEEIEAEIEAKIDQGNPIYDWAEANIECDTNYLGHSIPEMYDLYVMDNRVNPVSKSAFSRALKAFVIAETKEHGVDIRVRRIDGINTRCMMYTQLREENNAGY